MPYFNIHHALKIPSGREFQPFTQFVEITDEKDVAYLRDMQVKHKACEEFNPFGDAAVATDAAPVAQDEDLSTVKGVNKAVLDKLTGAGVTNKTGLTEALKTRREEITTLVGEAAVAKMLKSLSIE